MDAEQLWETTLDPKRRILKKVEIEDGRLASDVTEMLMGNEVPPRKAFIYKKQYGHSAYAGYLIRAQINDKKALPIPILIPPDNSITIQLTYK